MKHTSAIVLITLLGIITFSSKLGYAATCIQADSKRLMYLSEKYNVDINKASRKYSVDPYLIRSVIAIESCYNKKAISVTGARGLMQLMPDTADRFGVRDSFNSSQNILAGTKYIKFLHQRYQGNLIKVLAAYNAGEGRVDYYKGVPPYKETRLYVKNVMATYQKFKVANANKVQKTSVNKQVPKKKTKPWGKPGRQGYQALKQRAPHLFKR
jgi:hypothetical protein